MLAWALAKTLPTECRALVWMPVVAALCDVFENILHAIPVIQGTFRELGQPFIALSSGFAVIKWLLAVISIGFIVTGFFRGRRQ